MGVEGAPEGPEDPIAQICITVGKVRRLIQKNTRIDFKRREVFFFFSLFFSLSLSKSSTAAKDKKSLLVLVLVLLLLSCRVKNRV
jgi:hypothetical protein